MWIKKTLICFLFFLGANSIFCQEDNEDWNNCCEKSYDQWESCDEENYEEWFEDEQQDECVENNDEEKNDEEKNGEEKKEEEPYRLRVGDSLILGVYGELGTKREVTVGPTGTISFLMARSAVALGKTMEELRHDLTEQLKSYYRSPLVTITASNFTGNHYTITGEVRNPGKKILIGNPTILSALSQAGGFTTRLYRNQTIDIVDFDHSFLVHDGHYVPVNFERLVEYGDVSQDVPLHQGDYIYMASYVQPKVFVLGEVNRQLTVNYLDTISLAEAIAEAGGLTLRASSRVYVIRGALDCPITYYIDINRILKGYACNFWLEPGDIVYVPPMKFTHLKEIIQGGISTFISVAANIAGTNVFLEITPKAKNTNVVSPVPVIGTTTSGATQVAVPTGGTGRGP